jgi:hypothetical protein
MPHAFKAAPQHSAIAYLVTDLVQRLQVTRRELLAKLNA